MEIRINNLSKIYPGGHRALSGIDLTIREGMFGLLGPNGAGKSTLMRILVTIMKSSSGEVMFNVKDINKQREKVRKMLGYLPQDFRFFAKLRSWEFLDYAARLAGMTSRKQRNEQVDQALRDVGLYDVRNRMANKLSGGMKRRLGIAQALISNPSIIIVDEPTTGLDPEERIRFRNILSDLSHTDTIIILSTHIVGDISSTCNQMALLNEGELVFDGAPDLLVSNTKGYVWQAKVSQDQYEQLKENFPIISTIPSGTGWEIQFVGEKPGDIEAEEIHPNLEHAYVHFMENKLKHWTL